ncbi:16S rRNA (cytosine(967)-C(5))-methyltransferase RsmB [uncultured Xylophilus sp.]|uniref:16S rRNA (cytosine(967)-C(5))-methyltransferase RsmB n=1 Tax=uncultured Xylophilus sp. TaxID=296832 RepID=UPI0025D8D930|nr:16S rRNA (cytosine(967)-C(5))-methyltransferase RsmB [uncultured Xylophilus sp.]
MNSSVSIPGAPAAPAGSAPPLWQQLQAAAQVLAAVRGGQSAPVALLEVDASLRPGVRALVYRVLRWLGQAEALRRKLAPRTPPPLPDALLCTALALVWRESDAPYEPFTLVDQAVEAAKRSPAMRPQSGFVNACLRRFLRERDALVEATAQEPLAHWNHPRWWIERLKRDHPRQWQDILRANNLQAPMVLRVNERKTTRAQVLQALIAINVIAEEVGEHGVLLGRALPVEDIPGFADGHVSVQDAAAQLAAPLLLDGMDRSRPLRVLDACAAPGGKTAHLLEHAGADAAIDVTALDIDPARCERIHQNLDRLGLSARVVVADAQEPSAWWGSAVERRPFDAILLDAPCTASGIVRRQPDVRWLRRESDIGQLAIVQAALLAKLWPLVVPGGRLLYCTCSVFRDEGDRQIEAFLAHHTDAVLLPSPGHLLPRHGADAGGVRENLPRDHDGFFYALLHKRPG